MVSGSGVDVTYADLDAAPTVLLVGLEPEEESPIIFLRLRAATRRDRAEGPDRRPLRLTGLGQAGGPRPGRRTRAGARSARCPGLRGRGVGRGAGR